MGYKYTIIIPLGVCGDLGARAFPVRWENLLFSVENFYKKDPAAEIIVVAQNVEDRYLTELRRLVTVVPLSYPVFNKGWCINVGARRASTETLLISESEMWAPRAYLPAAVSWFTGHGHKWAFAWSSLVQTTNIDRNSIILNALDCSAPGSSIKNPAPGMFEGGIVMFNKQFFFNIGGANEFMQELGGIDNELILRAKYSSGTYYKYPEKIYHLWHNRVRINNSNTRKKNIELYKYGIKNPNLAIKVLRRCTTNEVSPWIARTSFYRVRTGKK